MSNIKNAIINNMKITYANKKKKDFREINLYKKDKEKKIDDKNNLYLNMKVPEQLDRKTAIRFICSMVKRAQSHKLEKIAFDYEQIKKTIGNILSEEYCAKLFVKNISIASYTFDKYKTKKENTLKEILIFGNFSKEEKDVFKETEIITKNINISRDLANTPGNLMTPNILVKNVKKIFNKDKNIKIKILGEDAIKKLKMNLIYSVGLASKEKSKFIILEYKNGKKNENPVAIIGKGITFDAGGLDIKPAGKFMDMYMDMTGSAIAIGILKSIVDLNIKKNIVVLIPAVENSVSGSSYRPGDIITSMSGKTVAIGNTDAEGRLVMADAITYAERYKPSLLIDIATLTGASLVALGQRATAIMSRSEKIQSEMIKIGNNVGEYLWPLPAWDEFANDLKSDYADIINSGSSRYGGTAKAGMFLYEFIKMYKEKPHWVHLDIAPRMESIDEDNLAKGATGEPIDLLVEYLRK